jgi:CRP/FNR family cyclic AMP-dependent transcriptional regulator
MRQGEPSDSGMMLILSGRIKVVGRTRGRIRVLAFRGAGDVIGELGALSGGPRVATAVAVERGEGIWISAAAMKAFAEGHPPARDALLGTVIAKLQAATSRRIRFDSLDVLSKVAICLREEAAYNGRRTPEGVTVRVTHPQLAELVGASVPSVQQALQRLRKLPGPGPVISADRGRITILRPDVLEDLARVSR